MPQDHKLPQQRFELKYLIEERITPQVRDFVSCHLKVDDHGACHPDNAYSVHSLYLDSDDLALHYATVNGTRNRFKLRLRYYDAGPNAPVFFEVKRHADNCILKQRCGLRPEAVPLALAGQLPEPEHLLSREPRHLVTMQQFNLLMNLVGARPKLHNHYLREAWVSPHDNSVRVNFDRQITAQPFFRPKAVIDMERPVRVFGDWVVLELKFITRFPNWCQELVRRFDLMQLSSSKYCGGVEALGPHRFVNEGRAWNWRDEPAFRAGPGDVAPHLAAAMGDRLYERLVPTR
jgi:hypothetical protein